MVCNTKNPLVKQNKISLDDLKAMQFITRERGSGTLEVIEYALKQVDFKLSDLQIEMQLGSTESIKSYLLNSECFAFMSIHAVSNELKNNEFIVLDVDNLTIERYFYIITLVGKSDSLSELFIQSLSAHYNLKL
ncbi:HTH-type transcriptional activator CmpR [compost metagenome]